jgi:Tol biopolymer transport system component
VSPFIDTPAEYTEPTLSPDETRVAYDVFDPNRSERFGYGPARVRGNIVVHDRVKGVSVPLTENPAGAWAPVWSPDGRFLVYSTHRGDDILELVIKDAADPAAVERPLKTTGRLPGATSWSPDGRFLLYTAFDHKTGTDIWLLPMAGDRTPIPLVRSEYSDYQARVSPDGRLLAYVSTESGRQEVYVQSFPTLTTKRRISSAGGADPQWRRDGKEIFYVAEDRQLMAVPISTEGSFKHGEAVPLFDTGMPPSWYEARNLYDVSRDGRFLFMQPVEDDRSAPVTVVLNPKLQQ